MGRSSAGDNGPCHAEPAGDKERRELAGQTGGSKGTLFADHHAPNHSSRELRAALLEKGSMTMGHSELPITTALGTENGGNEEQPLGLRGFGWGWG